MFKRTNKARPDDLGMLRASDIRTLMGLWIWYQILGDKASARALPDSPPERDRDELAFMEAAFGITIKGQAKKGWGDARFQSLASELGSRWDGEGYSSQDVLAILSDGLDGPLDLERWSDHTRLFQVMLAAVVTIIQEERWDEWMIVNMLNLSADVAEHWGYQPTRRPGPVS